MCGIVGYIGDREANDILIKGLEALEYRGYDSAGIAVINQGMQLNKVVGRVQKLKGKTLKGGIGIGHTRWATHGKPSVENAHPHLSGDKKIALVHNGIIENFLEIKNSLNRKFCSETDSEVIVHLIEEHYKGDLRKAVLEACKELEGTYAIAVLHLDEKKIVVARNGSPLIVGVGEGENFIASDVSALVESTKKVIYLDDLEIAEITKDNVKIFDFENKGVKKDVKTVDWDLVLAQKQGYKHFMLKEINEQVEVSQNSLKIAIDYDFKGIKKIFVTACGTAAYAGLVGKYLIEKTAKIPVEFDIASEFRYKDPLIGKEDLLIVISQSGETADTLAALRIAKEKGAKTLGLINVVESTIAREADNVIYTRAGPEIGVASTKAFISQLVALYLIAQKITGKKFEDLDKIPGLIEKILGKSSEIKEIAKKYFRVYNFLFIGRNLNYPIALEGALKLKEISYIHAEGYASGEMKHGPIALVTDEVPTVAIAPKDDVYSKVISNIQEIKARRGKIIAVATEDDKDIKKHADDVIYIPKINELLTPLLTVVPLQLLAYHIADLRDCDIDKPRNLAKSVTVE